MIGDPFSDDLPAGYSDADLEQAELERLGRASARARREGKCAHGWRESLEPAGSAPARDESPTKCLHCGKVAPWAQLDTEAREVLG